MQNNMVTLTYNPQNGTNNGIVYIPMSFTSTNLNPYFKESVSFKNKHTNTPVIQRTYRPKPYNYIKPQILDTEESHKRHQRENMTVISKIERKARKKKTSTERAAARKVKTLIQEFGNTSEPIKPVCYNISIRPYSIRIINTKSALTNTFPFMVLDVVSEETR